jgi:hypothetical protein
MAAGLMGSAFSGGGTDAEPKAESDSKPWGSDVTSAAGDDNKDIGIAVEMNGTDVIPDAGNKGFTDDVGDSPENLKDVDGIGGTDSHDAISEVDPSEVMKKVEDLLPKIQEFADDDSNSAKDDPELVDLDELLAKAFPDEYGEKKSSMVHEARRPKMCPFHTQLVDFSVALDNPGAALQSLGGLMYGGSSCLGGHEMQNKNGNPTKCRFKPEMIVPQYWKDQEAAAEQRRQQREEQMQQQMQPEVAEVPQIQEDPNSVTIPVQQIEELKADVPSVDAIETPDDYDPEAYWEAPEASEFTAEQPVDNVVPLPTQQAQPQSLEIPQPMLVAARRIAAALDPTNLASDVPDIPNQESVAQSIAEPIDAAPEEAPMESAVTDEGGLPLKAGAVYDMYDGDNAVPDQIKVTKVAPLFIEFEVVNSDTGFSFPSRLHTHTIKTDNIQFKTHAGSPNADGLTEDLAGAETNNDDNTHADDAGSVDDLSGGRSSHHASLSWLREDDEEMDAMMKEAGKHYSPNEQRGLIHEVGSARNLDKLDLEGTHYPSTIANSNFEEDDDSQLFI